MGRRNQESNVVLAITLCDNNDKNGIKEIVDGLHNKNTDIKSDCIKVLYEVGYRKPELIFEYVKVFINLLLSKNNRLVWCAMVALNTIVPINYDEIFNNKDIIIETYKN